MTRYTAATLLLLALAIPAEANIFQAIASKITGGGGAKSYVAPSTVLKAKKSFVDKFGEDPKHVFSAPGRVNLIGEHTDYNDGFVMPCAINHHAVAVFTPTDDDEIVCVSADMKSECKFSLKEPIKPATEKELFWSNYVKGVAKILIEEKGCKLKGCKIAFAGDVPQGAGLSSSAALEVVIGTAFNHMNNLGFGPKEVARIGQSAEHWVGCNCGIMDQLISACGKNDHALMIDCRDLSTNMVKIPKGFSVVIVNSNFKHALAGLDSEYNQRRSQCENAARHFGVTALRDVSVAELLKAEKELDDKTFRRARHVVTENDRVNAARKAMQSGDMKTMGRLMKESHDSMRDDFEITVPPIDALVEIIGKVVGTEGGVRMTGGGFGGSVVCLAPDSKVEAIRAAVEKEYPAKSGGLKAGILVCHPSDGARLMP